MKFNYIIYISLIILVNSNGLDSQLIISMLLNNQNELSINSSIACFYKILAIFILEKKIKLYTLIQ